MTIKGDDNEPTQREVMLMIRHIQGEIDALSKVLYGSMPKGSPERHLFEHETAAQEKAEKEKNAKELKWHIIRTLAIIGIVLVVQFVYSGAISRLSSEIDKQKTELPK